MSLQLGDLPQMSEGMQWRMWQNDKNIYLNLSKKVKGPILKQVLDLNFYILDSRGAACTIIYVKNKKPKKQ